MNQAYIIDALRTPIGSLNGYFLDLSAVELGANVVKSLLNRHPEISPNLIDEVIFGQVLTAGLGQNPTRQVSVKSGIPVETPAYTVNMVCGSGMKAIELGWLSIITGRANIVIAGGMENMSQAPYLLKSMRRGSRMGDVPAIDSMIYDGLLDIFNLYHMGITAENVAERYNISREEQDLFAYESQMKYAKAFEEGKFKEEIIPVTIETKKGPLTIEKDEHPKTDTNLEKLSKLKPAFKPNGTVTAGNASGINDGASAVLIVSEKSLNHVKPAFTPIRILDIESAGCDPAFMGLGPIVATKKLLDINKLNVNHIDLWELNEAFAAQSIPCIKEIGIDPQLVNVNGGAIALGHPIGCSGNRITVTLIHELLRRKAKKGIATLCIGGGMGIAGLFEVS
ncbi:MAG: acetyl-CoA C-acetyltransferase [Candidatus Hydrogenedentes bacterium]|nr:acetyl-CoA C-acetyltransferase [Candidatus Hydrogenedentota bacterium]